MVVCLSMNSIENVIQKNKFRYEIVQARTSSRITAFSSVWLLFAIFKRWIILQTFKKHCKTTMLQTSRDYSNTVRKNQFKSNNVWSKQFFIFLIYDKRVCLSTLSLSLLLLWLFCIDFWFSGSFVMTLLVLMLLSTKTLS